MAKNFQRSQAIESKSTGYSITLSVIGYFKSKFLSPVFTSFVSSSSFSFEERLFLHDDNIECQKKN